VLVIVPLDVAVRAIHEKCHLARRLITCCANCERMPVFSIPQRVGPKLGPHLCELMPFGSHLDGFRCASKVCPRRCGTDADSYGEAAGTSAIVAQLVAAAEIHWL
jgi:hypothetical protein